MAAPDPFSDCEGLQVVVRSNTVDRLKHIITGFNEECGTALSKSGKKQDLIERINRQLESWRMSQQADKFTKGKAVIHQVRTSGSYSNTRVEGTTLSPAATHSGYLSPAGPSTQAYPGTPVVPPPVPRYNPYARPGMGASTAAGSSVNKPVISFQASPFLRVDQSVSTVVECPESTSSVDRRQQTLAFNLNSDQLSKLNATGSRYQLRLYCTSSTFHSSSTFRVSSAPCPVEFPPACEVRINTLSLTANLKGLKKKPGTAPPPDLGNLVRLSPGATNRVEMVYVNSQQPVHGKKYYLVVMLIEVTGVEELVEKLKKGKFVSKQDILTKMKQAMSDDDDIVAGQQKMSLKCPLSYGRISTPCRSSLCVHPQCFDATSWFSMMEQTTTWLCPVCEKVLKAEELILDGYFDDILQHTPDSVEDVMVEADGQWHTTDNKFGSPEWLAIHPSKTEPPPVKKEPSAASLKPIMTQTNGKEKARPNGAEVYVLDSDDEDDEGRVKRELSPSYDTGTGTQQSQGKTNTQLAAVIDLTLDSDDEEPPRTTQKRKAVDPPSPTEQIWKKSRSTNGASSSSDPSSEGSHLSPARPKVAFNPARHASYNSNPSEYRRPPESRW